MAAVSGRNVRQTGYSAPSQSSRRQTDTGRSSQASRSSQTSRSRQTAQGGAYVYGNAVPKKREWEEPVREPERRIDRKKQNRARRNRERAEHMSPGYVIFLSLALFAMGWILIGYITLQSDITNSIQQISTLESELNDLKQANDEEYNRIVGSVNLEEIRRIAIQELGMQYASEGQIVDFTNENGDYVKQMASIPE